METACNPLWKHLVAIVAACVMAGALNWWLIKARYAYAGLLLVVLPFVMGTYRKVDIVVDAVSVVVGVLIVLLCVHLERRRMRHNA